MRKFAMGQPLLKTWKIWLGWVVVFTAIALVAISNQHAIEAKEDKILELEDTHRRLMLNLKEEGFVEVRENDYYIIQNK